MKKINKKQFKKYILYLIVLALMIMNAILIMSAQNQKKVIQDVGQKYFNSINTKEDLKMSMGYSIVSDLLKNYNAKLDSFNLVYLIPESSCPSCSTSEISAFNKYKTNNNVFGYYLVNNDVLDTDIYSIYNNLKDFTIIKTGQRIINPIVLVLDNDKNILLEYNADPTDKYNLKRRKMFYALVQQIFK